MTKHSTIIINSFVLLAIVLLSVCTVPASAVILNVSEVFAGTSAQTMIISPASDVMTYTLDLPKGSVIEDSNYFTIDNYKDKVIGKQVIRYLHENSKLNFEYNRVDGTKITGFIILIPLTSTAGVRTIHINENNFNSSLPYVRAPFIDALYAGDLYTTIVVDPGTRQQYFTIGEMVGGTGGSFTSWDNATVANIPITDIIKNPITKCYFISLNHFDITTYAVAINDYSKSLDKAIGTGVCEGNYWFCLLEWLFVPLQNAINNLSEFAGKTAQFLNNLRILSIFIFSGVIIIGMSAFYTAIAILLSIEDSDDLFKAFGKFISYERKLLRFYMEIFKAIKVIIKWW